MALNRSYRMPRIQVSELGQTRRIPRHPRHTARTSIFPWAITPFMLAPVIPGETLKQMLFQSRVTTYPLLRTLGNVGAHMEYYFFYVRLSQMPGAAAFTNMMVDPSQSLAAYVVDGGNPYTYTYDDGVDWMSQCLPPIVEHYFRDEGEAWDVSSGMHVIGGKNVPVVQLKNPGWMDSLVNKDSVIDPLDIMIDQTPAADISIADIDAKMRAYKFLLDTGITDMTYEDYLQTYGVRVPVDNVEVAQKPELIRFVREWAYPSRSTVMAASDTAISSAAGFSFNIAERADKDRFFPEPGFIVGISVFRPKSYSRAQSGAMAGAMNTPYAWLPAIMADDPRTSLAAFAAADGPLQSASVEYLVDLKDLLLYGDQWYWQPGDKATHAGSRQYDNAGTHGAPYANLGNIKYPGMADYQYFFNCNGTDATEAAYNLDSVGSPTVVKAAHDENVQDIAVSMTIHGRQVDRT